MSTRRIIRTERFSVSWRRDTTLAGILRRLCRLNWKMLISIQPRRDIPCRARHTGSLLPHPPPFSPLSHWNALSPFRRFSTTKLKLAKGNFTLLPVSLSPLGGERIGSGSWFRTRDWSEVWLGKKRTALSARRIFRKREWERVSIVWENRRDCLSMKILKFDWTRSCSFYLLTPRVIALLSFSVLVWQGLFPLLIISSPLWI